MNLHKRMKSNYIDNGLEPPDQPSKRELDREEFEQAAIEWVKTKKPHEIFDLYDHDKEIALKFYKWALDYSSIHLVGLLKGDYPTQDQLWELYCQQS